MVDLSLGFYLMGIGMVTVFVILLIVIFGSKGLINILNRIVPADQPGVVSATLVDAGTKKIIEAAVSELTGGKGIVKNITKI